MAYTAETKTFSNFQQAHFSHEYSSPHYKQCLALFQQERYQDCIQLAQQHSGEVRNNLVFLLLVGTAFKKTGQKQRAFETYSRCIQLDKYCYEALLNLGNFYFESEEYRKALFYFKKAFPHQTINVNLLTKMWLSFSRLGKHQESCKYVKKALHHIPKSAHLHYLYGLSLENDNRFSEAAYHMQKSIQINPSSPDPYGGLANIFIRQGRFHRVKPLIDHLLQLDPYSPVAHILKADLPNQTDWEAMNLALQTILSSRSCRLQEQIEIYFALGNVNHKRKEYNKAFEYWTKGNQLTQQQHPYKIKEELAALSNLRKYFTQDRLKSVTANSESSCMPIFIVGMPRSGTTLIEQILSSHPAVCGAGELDNINNIVLSLPKRYKLSKQYPFCLEQLTQDQLEDIAETYLQRLRKHDFRAKCIIDKMPGNFMHLGVIQTILPQAKIIHCKRSPLDTCLSCYSRNFGERWRLTTNFDDLAQYYKAYQELMHHWRSVLTHPILDVRYEDVIQHTEETVEKILSYCELPWDENCLRFYETKRDVKTASYIQVRQPIYTSALQRWRKYEKHLQPYLPLIGESSDW